MNELNVSLKNPMLILNWIYANDKIITRLHTFVLYDEWNVYVMGGTNLELKLKKNSLVERIRGTKKDTEILC